MTLTYKPGKKRITARTQLLTDLGFKELKAKGEWKLKKAVVAYDLIYGAHDSTFVEILQYALMQNYIAEVNKYYTDFHDQDTPEFKAFLKESTERAKANEGEAKKIVDEMSQDDIITQMLPQEDLK